MNLNDYVYRTIIKTEIYSYCFKLLRVFFLLFFFLHALQGERIKDIKKKKKVLASNFIHVREKDNYRHCRLLFP